MQEVLMSHSESVEHSLNEESPESNEGELDSLNLSEEMKNALRMRGVGRLYPVQYKSLEAILNGSDAIVQARTGTGKTFAFAVPLIEILQKSKKSRKPKAGRKPKILVLVPTRELAQQVSDDFQSVISSKLEVTAVFGGVDFNKHSDVVAKGVDGIVGTPGRLKDLLENEKLSLSHIKYVVLDEVDRMLDMGFREDVESILKPIYEAEDGEERLAHPQTLLFSATVPAWVEQFATKYLRGDDLLRLDLVEGDVNKTATTVEHLAIQCPWQERPKVIADVIKCYSSSPDSRCIVFNERKKDADELAADSSMSAECHVLHGDIPQEKRELVLKKFRSGKYKVLITTNVAARGLDISNVDLVIQCHPPKDVEDYIHRSGRTGRAGQAGQSICFYTMKEKDELSRIEKEAGIKFKRISAPTTSDLVTTAHDTNLDVLRDIPEATWKEYLESANKVISELGDVRAVACCLAKMGGHVDALVARSVLTCREGFTAYELKVNRSDEIHGKSYCFKALKRLIPEETVENISHLMFTKGRRGFVFDLPSQFDSDVEANWKDGKFDSLAKISELPELEEDEKYGGRGYQNGNNNDNSSRRFSDYGSGRGGSRGGFRGRGRGGDYGGRGGSFRGEGRGRGGSFRGGRGRGFKRSFDEMNDSTGEGVSAKRVVYDSD